MLHVSIASLPDGLHQETLRPTAEDLGLDPEVFSSVEVDVRLDVTGRQVLAQFDARAAARLECDRTLEMYDQPIAGSHAVLFVPPEAAPDSGNEDDDVRVLHDADQEIDLTEPVRDTLLLAVPLRRVSPAAEALELQTQYGTLDGDDRWAALRDLGSDPESDTPTD